VPSEKSLDIYKKGDHFYDIGKGDIFKEARSYHDCFYDLGFSERDVDWNLSMC